MGNPSVTEITLTLKDQGGGVLGTKTPAQAWSYQGVPYITDDVPAAIMPTLPTAGNKISGWGYDPTQISNPTFTAASNQYYVDAATGNDGTAGNSGRGTVALPRETFPGVSGNVWTLVVDDQVFIVGDGNTYTIVGTDFRDVIFPGTASQKIWLIGVGATNPIIKVDRFWFTDSSHVIIDNIDFEHIAASLRINFSGGDASTKGHDRICFRHCDMFGDGVLQTGGSLLVFKMEGLSLTKPGTFGCIYQCSIRDFGKWDTATNESTDRSAIVPKRYSRYNWIIENTVFHMQGDSVIPEGATFTSGTDFDNPAARTHYAYIAGNEFFENYEQAIDCKNSFHVIISENDIHDFFTAPKTANSTAIILSNNGEGPHTGFHWAIFNDISNSGTNINATGTTGIRDSGSEDGEKNYTIGNTIRNCRRTMVLQNFSLDRESYWVNNTCFNAADSGFDTFQPGSGSAILRVHANIFEDCQDIDTLGAVPSATLTDNVLFNTTDLGTWDVKSGNSTSDPLLGDPANGDYSLGVGSSAIDLATEDAVYQDFNDLYGIDIEVDINGTVRPQGSDWDAGAVEKV